MSDVPVTGSCSSLQYSSVGLNQGARWVEAFQARRSRTPNWGTRQRLEDNHAKLARKTDMWKSSVLQRGRFPHTHCWAA